MADVYISCAADDRPMAERIAARLAELGISTTVDESEAKAILVLWSQASVTAPTQLQDAARELSNDRLIACVIARCAVPPGYEAAATLENWDGARNDPDWLAVVGRIADVLQRPGLFELAHAMATDDETKKAEFARRYPDEPAAQEIRRQREVKERQAFEHSIAFARAGFDRRLRKERLAFDAMLKVYKTDFEHWLEDGRSGGDKPPPPPDTLIEAGAQGPGHGPESEARLSGLADRLAREHALRRGLGEQLQALQRQHANAMGFHQNLTSQALETANRHNERLERNYAAVEAEHNRLARDNAALKDQNTRLDRDTGTLRRLAYGVSIACLAGLGLAGYSLLAKNPKLSPDVAQRLAQSAAEAKPAAAAEVDIDTFVLRAMKVSPDKIVGDVVRMGRAEVVAEAIRLDRSAVIAQVVAAAPSDTLAEAVRIAPAASAEAFAKAMPVPLVQAIAKVAPDALLHEAIGLNPVALASGLAKKAPEVLIGELLENNRHALIAGLVKSDPAEVGRAATASAPDAMLADLIEHNPTLVATQAAKALPTQVLGELAKANAPQLVAYALKTQPRPIVAELIKEQWDLLVSEIVRANPESVTSQLLANAPNASIVQIIKAAPDAAAAELLRANPAGVASQLAKTAPKVMLAELQKSEPAGLLATLVRSTPDAALSDLIEHNPALVATQAVKALGPQLIGELGKANAPQMVAVIVKAQSRPLIAEILKEQPELMITEVVRAYPELVVSQLLNAAPSPTITQIVKSLPEAVIAETVRTNPTNLAAQLAKSAPKPMLAELQKADPTALATALAHSAPAAALVELAKTMPDQAIAELIKTNPERTIGALAKAAPVQLVGELMHGAPENTIGEIVRLNPAAVSAQVVKAAPANVAAEILKTRPSGLVAALSELYPKHSETDKRTDAGTPALPLAGLAAQADHPAVNAAAAPPDQGVATGALAAAPKGEAPSPASLQDCPQCPVMVAIPAGETFVGLVGDERLGAEIRDRSLHGRSVAIAKPFMLARNKVSLDEYKAFRQEKYGRIDPPSVDCRSFAPKAQQRSQTRNYLAPGFEQTGSHPVVCISWNDAVDYVRWLSAKTGKNYRLPSEAEWEYAARGGDRGPWHVAESPSESCKFGNILDATAVEKHAVADRALAAECSDQWANTSPAGLFPMNAFGLVDMYGNAHEWVQDCWNDDLRTLPANGAPRLGEDGSSQCASELRVRRGSAWTTPPILSGFAARWKGTAMHAFQDTGFRVAREPE
jgi:formylglycine-generating enzyme required for sulfatase activity